MFTVKQILNDGTELIMTCDGVRFEPALISSTRAETIDMFPRLALAHNSPNYWGTDFINQGSVYVMNENGKTVASYAFKA